MSVDSATAFLSKLRDDEGFRTSLEDADDDAARQSITKDAGFEFTKDELKEAMTAAVKDSGEELSDADLEGVAGGSSGAWIGVSSSSAAGAGSAAAAAAV